METRPLFGGAIRCAVPPSMRDQSLLIPVPDHQEVFLDHNTGECLIVEIVEHQPGSPQDVCRVYVEDMGQLNEATSVRDVVCETLEGLEAMPALREQATGPPRVLVPGLAGCRALTCCCTMDLPKDGIGVVIRILVVQLPAHAADVVVSLRQARSGTGSTAGFQNTLTSFVLGDEFGALFGA